MFSGVYWNQPVCLSLCLVVCVSICVQNTTLCQSAGRGIKSNSWIALVPNGGTTSIFFFVTEKFGSHLLLQEDDGGKITGTEKWRVENSWGGEKGDKGMLCLYCLCGV